MIRLLFCLRRKPDLSQEEFHAYWRDTHGPLVRRHADVLKIRRYLQLRPSGAPAASALAQARNAPKPYDGIAELWFDSVEDIDGSALTTEARAAAVELVEDEARFIDLRNSPLWLYDHEVIVG